MMTKDKEWLKEEIGELPCVDAVFNSDGSSYIDSVVPVMAVYDLIDQLDEPKQEEKKESPDALMARAFQNLGTAIKNSTDRRQAELELNRLGYVVIEKPTVPQFVAEWIETHKTSHSLYEVLWQAWNEDLDDHRLQKWIDNYSENHDEVFARAWLAYPNIEVEKEQKYLVNILDEGTGAYLIYYPKSGNYGVTGTLDDNKGITRFTEQEIKDYDERYWTFAVPVEELEE